LVKSTNLFKGGAGGGAALVECSAFGAPANRDAGENSVKKGKNIGSGGQTNIRRQGLTTVSCR